MSPRVLVAGIGNIFLGDDGFGVEVAQRLLRESFPEEVRVADFGIRGLHLAYELLDGYDLAILIDAAPRGGAPGTLYVIEPDLEELPGATATDAPALDAHGMDPVAVLAMARTLGGEMGRVLVVGCEPAEIEERIGLSEPIAGMVEEAVRVVRELVAAEVSLVATGAAGDR
ncbi:MAG: hydrogenase maturation protease [Gemmatimonadota bacterium]|nr:hydrogenase maturation protease [Gemmatimonadota bacterium]